MKKIILIFLLILVIIISGCINKKSEKVNDDYIKCEINKDTERAFCIQVYDPVCGEDGKTYSNGCVACQSVTKYKKGEC